MPDPAPPAPRVRDLAVGERPQERLQELGPAALSDTELVALLLRSGTRGHDVMAVSRALLAEAGSAAGLLAWTEGDFRRIRGIGRIKALQLVAVAELARRALASRGSATPVLNRPELVRDHLEPHFTGLAVEKFWVLCLNRKNRLLKRVELTSGTATSSLAHPREVFREAIRQGATAVICAHNHPSGDPAPSAADVQLTRQLRDAARAVDIDLLDHVVLGHPGTDPLGAGFYSFRQAGVL